MSQCVPSWDLLDSASCPAMRSACSDLQPSDPLDVPVWDNDVAELAWENGNISMHGLVHPKINSSRSRTSSPPPSKYSPRACCFLDSLIDQEVLTADDLVPWLDGFHHASSLPMDALVPCSLPPPAASILAARKGVKEGGAAVSGSGSVTFDRPESEGKEKTGVVSDNYGTAFHQTTADIGSVFPSRPSMQMASDEKKDSGRRSSASTKRSRVAAVHNLTERKRRDRINQRIKTLQSLVPNSSKTDKASVLDEVIQYVKQLKSEVQAKNKQPPAAPAQQQLQMAVGVGFGMGVDIDGIPRPVLPALPAQFLHPSVVIPLQAWDAATGGNRLPTPAVAVLPESLPAYFASQPMSADAYGRMTSLYRQLYQPPCSSSMK